MYNQNYEQKNNYLHDNHAMTGNTAFGNTRKPIKKKCAGISFGSTVGWMVLLALIGGFFVFVFKLINSYVYPFKTVIGLGSGANVVCLALGAVATFFVLEYLKKTFSMSLKWWQTFLFLWVIFGSSYNFMTNVCELLNSFDFWSKEKVYKYYVKGRDSKGHSVYNSRTKSKKDVWTYYLYIKPDIESKDSETRKIVVDKGSYDIAEGGDNWFNYTKPGLFGYEHVSKRPKLIHNGIGGILIKRQLERGTEDCQLKLDRMELASKCHRLRDLIKKYPHMEDVYKAEIAEHEAAIQKIAQRESQLEIELYRSLQK